MSAAHNGNRRGIFVLSLDTELAWGTFDVGGLERYGFHFSHYRELVERLLALLDRYEIPATWAVVGHLLLDKCERPNGEPPHPNVLRPRHPWFPHDWHHYDPGTDVERDPWWYAPDVIERILSARVSHELGTHTFSHVIVGDPSCTEEIFRSQLQACVEAHARYGLELRSIVYPRNEVAYLDVLPEFGIVAYRGPEERWYLTRRVPSWIGQPAHLLDRALGRTPRTYPLEGLRNGRVVNVPASMFLLSRDGLRRRVPLASRRVQGLRGIRRAVERGELFHLWFHPFNLGSDPGLFDVLEAILRAAAEARERGELETLTMYEASRHVAT